MDISKYMTPRLLAASKFVKPGSRVADIGTDHAYIPIWLVKNGISTHAIAMDINEGPILRARENICKFGLESQIETRLSDGLDSLKSGEADTVVIAGMGGILINRILENAKRLYPTIRHYILQPMTAIEETRKYLEKNGFYIEDECLAKEDDKIYNILSVVRGDMEISKEIHYYIGEKLIENRDALLLQYLDGKIYELDKAIDTMQRAETTDAMEKRAHFINLRKAMQTIKENCTKW